MSTLGWTKQIKKIFFIADTTYNEKCYNKGYFFVPAKGFVGNKFKEEKLC